MFSNHNHHGGLSTLSVFGTESDQGTQNKLLRDLSPEKTPNWEPDPNELKLYKSAQTVEKIERTNRDKSRKGGNRSCIRIVFYKMQL